MTADLELSPELREVQRLLEGRKSTTSMPPPMPLLNTWNPGPGPGAYPVPSPGPGSYGGPGPYPGPESYAGPGPYQGPGPSYYPGPGYPAYPPMAYPPYNGWYPHPGYPARPGSQAGRLDRETSTDEGENTSQDAGELSSSEASGSGRRRQRQVSPAPPRPVRHHNTASPGHRRHRPSPSPKHRQKKSVEKQNSPAGPGSQESPKQNFEPQIEVDGLHLSTFAPEDKVPGNGSELGGEENCEDIAAPAVAVTGGQLQSDVAIILTSKAVSTSEGTRREKDDSEKKTKDHKNIAEPDAEKPDQLLVSEPEPEVAAVQTSESESSEAVGQQVPERRVSVDRERKSGAYQPAAASKAYQQLVAGSRSVQSSEEEEEGEEDSSSDSLELLARPRVHQNGFSGQAQGGVHVQDHQHLGEPSPSGQQQQHQAVRPVVLVGGLGGAVGRGGLGGHPVPLGLAGGRLGHPAAQRMGLLALGKEEEVQQSRQTAGQLSAPHSEDEDDFWS